jgi:hypothetical protein
MIPYVALFVVGLALPADAQRWGADVPFSGRLRWSIRSRGPGGVRLRRHRRHRRVPGSAACRGALLTGSAGADIASLNGAGNRLSPLFRRPACPAASAVPGVRAPPASYAREKHGCCSGAPLLLTSTCWIAAKCRPEAAIGRPARLKWEGAGRRAAPRSRSGRDPHPPLLSPIPGSACPPDRRCVRSGQSSSAGRPWMRSRNRPGSAAGEGSDVGVVFSRSLVHPRSRPSGYFWGDGRRLDGCTKGGGPNRFRWQGMVCGGRPAQDRQTAHGGCHARISSLYGIAAAGAGHRGRGACWSAVTRRSTTDAGGCRARRR